MQIAKADSGRILKLSGALQIDGADELRAALLDFVGAASRPVVDLSDVTECDTAGWQLLISASRTAERSAKTVELVGLSAAVREAGAVLGLSGANPVCRGSEDAI